MDDIVNIKLVVSFKILSSNGMLNTNRITSNLKTLSLINEFCKQTRT